MLAREVDYRLAKWMLADIARRGAITREELREAQSEIAKYYEPPFLSLEDFETEIGDGVMVGER